MSEPSRTGAPYRLLVWVGIVAGIVFIVATVFVAGLMVAWSTGGHQGWHQGAGSMSSGCPMMGSGKSMPSMPSMPMPMPR